MQHPFILLEDADGTAYVCRRSPLGPPVVEVECPSIEAAVDARRALVRDYMKRKQELRWHLSQLSRRALPY